jgi:hypothetical protein
MTNEETLKTFATKYRLKLRLDVDETRIIFGRAGQIHQHDLGRLGVMYMPAKAKSAEMWNSRRKACIAVGMELHQDGDREGSLLFDPRNAAQAKLAIQVAGVKKRRLMSPAQKEVLTRARALLLVKTQVGADSTIVSTPPQEANVGGFTRRQPSG